MGKSLMIINTPKSCEECDTCVLDRGKHYCVAKGTHISKGEKDCSCPLVAVPEKIEPERARNADEESYIDGWNACIDKILGGSSGK